MKSISILACAGVYSLVSCSTEPIYYDNGTEAPVSNEVFKEINGTPALPTAQRNAPAVSPPRVTQKTQKLPKNNSPFMRPDVFGMPSKEDLKETSSATRRTNSTPGLTVPN